MGDMADYTLEGLESEPWYPADIQHSDYFANVMYDEVTGGFEGPGIQTAKTCRYCGKRGLTWGRHNGGWRLFDDDELHVCTQGTLRGRT